MNSLNNLKSKISVIILNYNYGKFLTKCVESVLEQTRLADEIIIMDDCSNDDSINILKPLTEKKSKINYVLNNINLGTPGNCNKGLSIATGDYVMMLGADNWLDHSYLEKTAKVLDEIPFAGIVYTYTYCCGIRANELGPNSQWFNGTLAKDNEGNNLYVWAYPDFDHLKQYQDKIVSGNFIHGSAMFRRKFYTDGIRYKEVERAEDWHFWKDIIAKGHLPWLIKEPLLYYRQHSAEQRNQTK